jgi:outer membrane protein assembly factor BamB
MIDTLTSFCTGKKPLPILALLLIALAGCDAEASRDYGVEMEDSRWEWARQAGGSDWTYGTSISTMLNGDPVVAGFMTGGAKVFDEHRLSVIGSRNGFLVRYSARGRIQWIRQIGERGSVTVAEHAHGPATPILVVGAISEHLLDREPGLARFGSSVIERHVRRDDGFLGALRASDGEPLWAVQWNEPGKSEPNAVAVGPDGDIFVAGIESTSQDEQLIPDDDQARATISRFSPEGERVWSYAFERRSAAGSVVVGEDDGLYVTGRFLESVPTGLDGSYTIPRFFVARFTLDGELVWTRTGRAEGIDPDAPRTANTLIERGVHIGTSSVHAVAARPGGGVVVGGGFRGRIEFAGTEREGPMRPGGINEVLHDAFVAAFDGKGEELWIASGGGPVADFVRGIAVDRDGNVYATGDFMGTATFDGQTLHANDGERLVFVAKYSADGELQWVEQSTLAQRSSGGTAIAVSDDGRCYVTGFFDGQARFGQHRLTGLRSRNMFVAALRCLE